jgi:hypothetical protein
LARRPRQLFVKYAVLFAERSTIICKRQPITSPAIAGVDRRSAAKSIAAGQLADLHGSAGLVHRIARQQGLSRRQVVCLHRMKPAKCAVTAGALPVLRAQTPAPTALPPWNAPLCRSWRRYGSQDGSRATESSCIKKM